MEKQFSETDIVLLKFAALCHDVGKLYVRQDILEKPGPLNDDEWVEMRKHSEYGAKIVDPFDFNNCFSYLAKIVRHHHEKIDGTGYPDNLKGMDIPLGSRLVAIPDAYNVMTHRRVYNHIRRKKDALDEIMKNSGTQFDPDLARIFCDYMAEDKK